MFAIERYLALEEHKKTLCLKKAASLKKAAKRLGVGVYGDKFVYLLSFTLNVVIPLEK